MRSASSEPALTRLAQEVPNIITPDGDGKNDRFELPLPIGTCRLMIYDQRYRLVFSSQQYDNNWDASGLPAGNYFYLVETAKPTRWRSSGYIEVRR
jgi:gliding motility-associated-like protein